MMIECPSSLLSSTSKPDFQVLLQQQFPIPAWTSGSQTGANPILHWISSYGSKWEYVVVWEHARCWRLHQVNYTHGLNKNQSTVVLAPCLNWMTLKNKLSNHCTFWYEKMMVVIRIPNHNIYLWTVVGVYHTGSDQKPFFVCIRRPVCYPCITTRRTS